MECGVVWGEGLGFIVAEGLGADVDFAACFGEFDLFLSFLEALSFGVVEFVVAAWALQAFNEEGRGLVLGCDREAAGAAEFVFADG